MGNCMRHETEMQWGGDDWGTMFSRDEYDDDVVVMGKIKGSISRRKGTRLKTEVKIRMSKKQLEEMLRKLDVKDKVSVRQVISQLIRMSDHHRRYHRRSWRPTLNSIPEI